MKFSIARARSAAPSLRGVVLSCSTGQPKMRSFSEESVERESVVSCAKLNIKVIYQKNLNRLLFSCSCVLLVMSQFSVKAGNDPVTIPAAPVLNPSYSLISSSQPDEVARPGDPVVVTFNVRAANGTYTPSYLSGETIPGVELYKEWGIYAAPPTPVETYTFGDVGEVDITFTETFVGTETKTFSSNTLKGTWYKLPGQSLRTPAGATVNITHRVVYGPREPNKKKEKPDDPIIWPPSNNNGGTPPREDCPSLDPEIMPPFEKPEDNRTAQELAPAESVEFVAEGIVVLASKRGFDPYTGQDFSSDEPYRYYLTEHVTTSLSGGNPESPVGGSITRQVHRFTGEVYKTAISGNPSYYGVPGSASGSIVTPTGYSGSFPVSGYDDCPNLEEDEPATMHVNGVLMDEYTTAMLKADAFYVAYDFKGEGFYKTKTPSAYLLASERENMLDFKKVQYKVRIPEEDIEAGLYLRPFKVTWLEVFTPKDEDPDDGVEPDKEVKVMTAQIEKGESESRVFTINPSSDPNKEGTWDVVTLDFIPDFNRDGVIGEDDRWMVTDANPFRWWINDDNDKNATDGRGSNLDDLPGQNVDNSDAVVNDFRDLIDFFPLHLDLEEVLEILPKDKYKYFINHSAAAVNLFEIPGVTLDGSVKGKEVNSHILDYTRAEILSTYPVKKTATGYQLSEGFLDAAKSGKGALYMEAIKDSEEPIILEVKNAEGSKVFEYEFPVKFVGVEDMYRHVNLRALMGGAGGHATQKGEPSGYPDKLTKDKYVAYVHGYNISGEQSRGSHSNIFKRLHQLGNKARYVGVAWYGDPPNPTPLPNNQPLPPDYHAAVHNGLDTASLLNSSAGLSFTQGKQLTVLAHSLGNSVVSNAVANHSLNCDHYFMINCAMPIQAYDSDQTSNSSQDVSMERNMTEDDWKPYFDHYGQKRLFAANWHALFNAPDNRRTFTWKNIFKKEELLSVAYNFYSPSDHVVENPDSSEEFSHVSNLWAAKNGGRHAWVSQEIAKGGQSVISLAAFADVNGGWDFNPSGYKKIDIFELSGERPFSPLEAYNEISYAHLQMKPFHREFYYSALHDLEMGSQIAGSQGVRYKTLATGIPATSYAVAVNQLEILEPPFMNESRNLNMPSAFKNINAPWPEHEHAENPGDWMHGDFKDVALPYVFPMYEKVIELGTLNK